MSPNADFVPVYTEDDFLVIKAYAKVGMTVQFSQTASGEASAKV